MKAPLYQDYRVGLFEMMRRDPEFSLAYLEEAMQSYHDGEGYLARAIVRNIVDAIMGFELLAEKTGRTVPSLKRMLTPSGNPGMDTFLQIVQALRYHIQSQMKGRKRRKAA